MLAELQVGECVVIVDGEHEFFENWVCFIEPTYFNVTTMEGV